MFPNVYIHEYVVSGRRYFDEDDDVGFTTKVWSMSLFVGFGWTERCFNARLECKLYQ